MNLYEAMESRHSVRSYTDAPIEKDVLDALQAEIDACNAESVLHHIQLITDEPDAFGGFMAHYGKFTGVKNYIALVGRKVPELSDQLGYYGERIVLRAQMLGLNTCWVALTYSKWKSKCVVSAGERLVCVIAIGYGTTQGVPHRSKPMEQLCKVNGEMPDWFARGMQAALLAPTAVNQQSFIITLSGSSMVNIKSLGGPCSKIDLGIVRCHFDFGVGKKHLVLRPVRKKGVLPSHSPAEIYLRYP